MGLFDGNKEEGVVQDPVGVGATEAVSADKEKRAAAAERFKKNRAEKAQKVFENANKLKDILVKEKVYDKLDDATKNFIADLCRDPAEKKPASGGSSTFNVLFGDHPKVGDSVTLLDVFNKTLKGKATIDHLAKRWAEKGTVIEFKADLEKMQNSTYTIISIG